MFNEKVFADRLRELRLKARLSQEDLAEKSGLTGNLIWRYENRRTTPGIDKVYAIAEALGCTVDDLLRVKEVA